MSAQNNPFGDEPNTGHIWDGNLRELTNPPPKWWMYGLHASWIFVLAYFILYPSIPLLTTHTKGVMNWTSIREYKDGLKEVEDIKAQYEARIAALPVEDILKDKELATYIAHSGKVLFGDNCSACHGAGGAGRPGFPVLADDDWLYGGSIEQIYESISGGRSGQMPAFAASLTEAEIADVTRHILALSEGKEHSPGKEIFEGKGTCSACHGEDGGGNQIMGAANFRDRIWRFSGDEEQIRRTIAHGVNDSEDPETRREVMPSFEDRLSEPVIKKLAVYVHQFGGGQ
jgi:cytochrome c oxidase cbb3-type subunit 3